MCLWALLNISPLPSLQNWMKNLALVLRRNPQNLSLQNSHRRMQIKTQNEVTLSVEEIQQSAIIYFMAFHCRQQSDMCSHGVESGSCSWSLDKYHGVLQYKQCSICWISSEAPFEKLLHNILWNKSQRVGRGVWVHSVCGGRERTGEVAFPTNVRTLRNCLKSPRSLYAE